jgi:hypothetical protein
LWPPLDEKRPGQLEKISGINYAAKSRNYLQVRNQGSEKDGGLKLVIPKFQQRNLGHPPAHRDRAAMNGAQLVKAQCGSSGLMSGAPAGLDQPANPSQRDREKSTLNSHGTCLKLVDTLRLGVSYLWQRHTSGFHTYVNRT